MLFTKCYTVLEKFSKNIKITTPLCIFKTSSIIKNIDKLSKIIESNKNVEFWLATNDCSKESVNKANIIGIKNIIVLPIDESLITEHFNKDIKDDKFKFVKDMDLSNMNVAVVDDNDMNITLLSEILTDLNVNIVSYIKPESILNTLEIKQYDLFLLDILMPNISGIELAEEIKKSKLNSTSPIVFISAISDVETKLSGYELGAYSYIEKPYNVEVVKSQIFNILKKQQQNKTLNKQKENFVAMLTHDLKSPINAEINALELLIEKKFGDISNSQKEIISGVLNSAKYMKHITDQILTYYKNNNGSLLLHKENVIFENIVIESIEYMRFLLEEKKQKIHLINELINSEFNIDLIEIKRVILNLIGNAIEYSPENSEILIKIKENSSNLIFQIKDNGYGIDEKNMDNIFDEYMSLAKKQKKVGFGLGLNICKMIIQAHGGTINLDSHLGEGTSITFTIPKI